MLRTNRRLVIDSPSSSPEPRTPSFAQCLPRDIVDRIARFHRQLLEADAQFGFIEHNQRLLRLACVCKSWRAAGTTAYWHTLEFDVREAKRLAARFDIDKTSCDAVQHIVLYLDNAWPANDAKIIASVVASTPNCSHLDFEAESWVQPGSLFRELQTNVNTSIITSLSMCWGDDDRHWYAAMTSLSPVLVLDFLRACKNLHSFTLHTWDDVLTDPKSVPPARRIKLCSLDLAIRNHDRDSPLAQKQRMRLLANFNLSSLQSFTGVVAFSSSESWSAVSAMLQVEELRLEADFNLELGGLDNMTARMTSFLKLRHLEISIEDWPDPTHEMAPSEEQLQAFLDALPHTLEHVQVELSFPNTTRMVSRFVKSRIDSPLRRFEAYVHSPVAARIVPVNARLSRRTNDENDFVWLSSTRHAGEDRKAEKVHEFGGL